MTFSRIMQEDVPPTVLLSRHGERESDESASWVETAQFPHDPDLSWYGRRQAKQLAQRLKRDGGVSHIVSSPFLAAVRTADIIAEELNIAFKVDPGVGEWMTPHMFGRSPRIRSIDELREMFPRIETAYTPCGDSVYPEVSEQVLSDRCSSTITKLLATLPDEPRSRPPLIVTHAAPLIMLARGLLRPYRTDVPPMVKNGCCSLTRISLQKDKTWGMEKNGEVSHVSAGPTYEYTLPSERTSATDTVPRLTAQ